MSENNQNQPNNTEETKEEYSVCMEIAGAESIEGLNVEAPKAKDCK